MLFKCSYGIKNVGGKNNVNDDKNGKNHACNNNVNSDAQEASMDTENKYPMEYNTHVLATKIMHTTSTTNIYEWIVDSGCTKHLTASLVNLQTLND